MYGPETGKPPLLVLRSRSLRDTLHLFVKTGVKPLAEANRQLEDTFICREDQDVACRVDNRRADLAVLKVLLPPLQAPTMSTCCPSNLRYVPKRVCNL
jgi:hypothetical protein